MDPRARRFDETTTRVMAFDSHEDDDVPLIRVVVRAAPGLLDQTDAARDGCSRPAGLLDPSAGATTR